MTVMTAENVLSHLSHPLGLGQRDKSGTRLSESLGSQRVAAGQHMGRKRDNRSQVGGTK